MLRYLNLDLLYNVNDFLFPLFYYQSCNYSSSYRVYCPMAKKCVYINPYYTICYDFITKKRNCQKDVIFDDTKYIFTENTAKYKNITYNKCKPFKLNSKDLYFLKNNTRIN